MNVLPVGLFLFSSLLSRLPFCFHFRFRFLDRDFPGSPTDVVQVGDRVDNEQEVHGGDAKQVDDTRQDAMDFLKQNEEVSLDMFYKLDQRCFSAINAFERLCYKLTFIQICVI